MKTACSAVFFIIEALLNVVVYLPFLFFRYTRRVAKWSWFLGCCWGAGAYETVSSFGVKTGFAESCLRGENGFYGSA